MWVFYVTLCDSNSFLWIITCTWSIHPYTHCPTMASVPSTKAKRVCLECHAHPYVGSIESTSHCQCSDLYFVVVFYMTFIALIASITTLDNLAKHLPFIKSRTKKGFLSEILICILLSATCRLISQICIYHWDLITYLFVTVLHSHSRKQQCKNVCFVFKNFHILFTQNFL